MEINGVMPSTKSFEKRGQSMNASTKSRDKNFRIMKKAAVEKREDSGGLGGFGMMIVTGLGQQSSQTATQQPFAR